MKNSKAFKLGDNTTMTALAVQGEVDIHSKTKSGPVLNLFSFSGATMLVGEDQLLDLQKALKFALTSSSDEVIKVAKITSEGTALYVRVSNFAEDIDGMLDGETGPFTIEFVEMMQYQFENLPDFNGF